jgi:hypothetical protein
MSVTFYVDNKQARAWLRLPGTLADYLLLALGYEPWDLGFFRGLRPNDVLARIASVRRQFALGRGCEFTSAEIKDSWLLGELAELEKLARRARESETSVLVL